MLKLESSQWRYGVIVVALLFVLLLNACFAGTSNATEETGAAGGDAIVNKGSDTLVNVALAWAETYLQDRPDLNISVTGGGSGTGIAAMINGTVDIANASREMKDSEIAAAEANGITPVEHVVSLDAIAVIVHHDNPIDELTIQQIADIFTGEVTNWRELGGPDAPIVVTSRESNSGTHVYFLEEVVRVGAGDPNALFTPDALLLPSSEVIGLEVERNPNAIGYDGLGYVTEEQKIVAVSPGPGEPAVLPSITTVNAGEYPISRPLYMYTAGEPSGEIAKYLEWILGPEGQEIVRNQGFVPLETE